MYSRRQSTLDTPTSRIPDRSDALSTNTGSTHSPVMSVTNSCTQSCRQSFTDPINNSQCKQTTITNQPFVTNQVNSDESSNIGSCIPLPMITNSGQTHNTNSISDIDIYVSNARLENIESLLKIMIAMNIYNCIQARTITNDIKNLNVRMNALKKQTELSIINSNEVRRIKEIRDARDLRDLRDAKEARERDARDARETREREIREREREIREKEMRSSRDSRFSKESKESKESRDKDVKDYHRYVKNVKHDEKYDYREKDRKLREIEKDDRDTKWYRNAFGKRGTIFKSFFDR